MPTSVFELFRIGIGPSSSHTLGPMRAALAFAAGLERGPAARIEVELFGSLAATARGHGSDRAVILGLLGEAPERLDPDRAEQLVAAVRASGQLRLPDGAVLPYDESRHLRLIPERLPFHPNGMRFSAFGAGGECCARRTFYSVGGGFIKEEGGSDPEAALAGAVPFQFSTAAELLDACRAEGLSIGALTRRNEEARRTPAEVDEGLAELWQAMQDCVRRGCRAEGLLPGGLGLRRRAPQLFQALAGNPEAGLSDPLTVIDWVNLYALAVNEENAAGGRVVTAPTNGAAGVLPAVMHYYRRFVPGATDLGAQRMLLTAGAIGSLCKANASISGAEVGCQGEVGSACSMAAAALAEALGGSPEQAANAAEIAMEHNLGLTCDPVAGLVQVPCIERNAMGAVKAVNAARLALRGDGASFVSFDQVLATMRETGRDMRCKYKETALGGLAAAFQASVGLPDC